MVVESIGKLEGCSQQCVRFIHNNRCLPKVELGEQAVKLADRVYKSIIDTAAGGDVQESPSQTVDSADYRFVGFYDNPFVSVDIQEFIENGKLTYKKYTGKGIDIHVYEYEGGPRCNISRIFHICRFMRRLAGKWNDSITLHILCTDKKKQLEVNGGDELTAKNVNSGSTIAGEVVHLWRVEELPKVLIHELVHYFKMDLGQINPNGKYKVQGEMKLNEAYTELIAVFVHTVYTVYLLDGGFNLDGFKEALSYEVNWSLYQVAKLMDHYGMKGVGEFHKIKQSTAVFSYYFVKGAVLLDLLGDTGVGDNFYTDVLGKDDRVDWFIGVVDRALSNEEFDRCVKGYISNIDGGEVGRCLRMTCLQVA